MPIATEMRTEPGADPARIPPATMAEFGANPLEAKAANELAQLEAQINAQLTGQTEAAAAPAPQPEAITAPPAPQAAQPAPTPTPAPTVAQPQGVPLPTGVEVPQKFKNPDGTLNEDRLSKSLVNLEHYLQLEREMHQRQTQPQMPPQMAQMPQQPVYYAPQPEPLEARVNRDIQQDPGTTVLNLMRAAVEQSTQIASAKVTELNRKLELMEIGQEDPGVFTKEGASKLADTIRDNPWLLQSPTPWTHAYRIHGPITPKNRQAYTATPNSTRQPAPILPGGQAAPPIPSSSAGFNLNSQADLRRVLLERFPNNPQAQADYLEKIMMGLEKQRRG